MKFESLNINSCLSKHFFVEEWSCKSNQTCQEILMSRIKTYKKNYTVNYILYIQILEVKVLKPDKTRHVFGQCAVHSTGGLRKLNHISGTVSRTEGCLTFSRLAYIWFILNSESQN